MLVGTVVVVVEVVVEARDVGVDRAVVVPGGEVGRTAVVGGEVGRGTVCSVAGTTEPGAGATSGRTST